MDLIDTFVPGESHVLIWAMHIPLIDLSYHDDIWQRDALYITSTLWGESTDHWWIPLTKV